MSSPSSEKILKAVQLGWTIVEIYSHLSSKPLPYQPNNQDRLFLSDLGPSPTERLWMALQRLLGLVEVLFPEEAGSEKAVEKYPPVIGNLLEQLERQLTAGEALDWRKFNQEQLFQTFHHWSREIRVALERQAYPLAEAATLGASLADTVDTYWQLGYPENQEKLDVWQKQYNNLLKSERMGGNIRRIRQIEAYLPWYLGPILRHTLWEWGIAREITRSRKGHLHVATRWLYPWRSISLVRNLRNKMNQWQNKNKSLPLSLTEAQDIRKQLEAQRIKWHQLILGQPPAYFLHPSDWIGIRWSARISWVVCVSAITIFLALFVVVLFLGVVWLMSFIQPSLQAPTSFEDQLALAAAFISVMSVLWSQIRKFYTTLPSLYERLYSRFYLYQLMQRTYVSWNVNKAEKPLLLILLQQLLLGGGA